MDLGLKNKRVLITGASRGIGEEIAKQFAAEGCKLILIARNKKNLKEVINKIGGKKNDHSYISANLTKVGAPTKVANKILKKFKKIDIIVHNIGGGLGNKDVFTNLKGWIDVWMFNVGISIEINNVIVPKMIKNKWGRIINISSLNSLTGGTTSHGEAPAPAYTCAKSYLNMYSKILGREVAKDNVIVSAVMPGVIISKGKYWEKLSKKNPKIVKNYIKNHQSVGRFGNAKEIAPFVLILASKHATYSSAANINIDGGYL